MFRKTVIAATVAGVAAAGALAPAADAARKRTRVTVPKPVGCVKVNRSQLKPVCVFKRGVSVEMTGRTQVRLPKVTLPSVTLPTVGLDLPTVSNGDVGISLPTVEGLDVDISKAAVSRPGVTLPVNVDPGL